MIGVGIDIVDITSIDLDNSAFLRRFFTDNERSEAAKHHSPQEYYAGRFAVKEAAFKAAGNAVEGFNDLALVEVLADAHGKPTAKFVGPLTSINRNVELLISISNESGLAAAICAANHRDRRGPQGRLCQSHSLEDGLSAGPLKSPDYDVK